jgi:hypothetical protein
LAAVTTKSGEAAEFSGVAASSVMVAMATGRVPTQDRGSLAPA